MAKQFMLMEPKNENFNELIGGPNKYIVPRFQRDYAWDVGQWEDLWGDINSLDDEGFHYMGYIVLQQKEQYQHEIIDGQQRLVTLSIIVLAAMKAIKTLIDNGEDVQGNTERLDGITQNFVGSKNFVTLKVINKLELNRNNKSYFQRMSSHLEAQNSRGITSTNKLIRKCFDFFCKKDYGKTGAEIAQFIADFSSSMIFTKIIVQDDLNAYKVFETLNARGVQLSTPDLLKNYLFSIVTKDDQIGEEELNDLDEQWSEMIVQLGESNVSDYIRYHYNSQRRMVTKNNLFSSMRKILTKPEEAYQYLKSLIDYSPIYASLINPNDAWWGDQDVKYRNVLHYLNGIRLFNIKQPLTIFLAAFGNFSPEEFVKLVKYIYILSIRYNIICHLSPSEQENIYNQIANKVYNREFLRASHVKNSEEFKRLYPEDNAFFNAFEFHRMPSRQTAKKIRFLLSEIEGYLGNPCDYEKTTLEHICPYHPEKDWNESFGEGINDVKDRLGNMILMDKDNLKRSSFEEKKKEYTKSGYKLALKVTEYAEWNLESVNDFQKWMSQQAVNVWKVD
ncbi:TPA: DUF262 domain-containing protein [Klebsiella pneumoniae]|uniref:DUF262 domain-containing protein n=1 Tax=Klebsiella pneumoniae TaxID=573 RepID=UPI001CE0CDCC|nr:DUF262 domain-containing protein [Klebsiella pneumoniae]MCA5272688.1 DUF262 domain-containing HNH endonuclease family protein [Klebsiella pneumoniae]MCA5400176.1 DUF262 domain-containing HNH endonuclease family protein [Klebsiella pneumoniae]MCU7767543.1 DUF262 domain-containing HNH endonuclease family protein [Klebsiella pneumoniae]MDE8392428.1 DUF262 domain-containing HNH endonuclease family protein [Klebsiella pneumoniae]HBR1303344.1 DUF262 domain-containing protein [Klebsiella pneumonia